MIKTKTVVWSAGVRPADCLSSFACKNYKSKGVMAIIGNSEVVMEAGPLRGRGFLAWSAWLWIHLLTKAGFHANVFVTFKWIFNYLSGTRLGRLITRPELQGLPESIKNAPEAKDAGAEKQAS